MLKSVLLSLVSVMLCIIVTFSAFGIELHPTAFFTDLLKVEGFVGDTADTILSARDKLQAFAKEWLPKVKEAFKPILDVFDSLRDFFVDLDERFAILDTISTWFENVLLKVSDFLDYTNVFIRYIIDFGFKPMDREWQDGLSVAYVGFDNGFYFDEKGTFDKKAVEKFVDAVLNGAENEFSYFVHKGTIHNITTLTDSNVHSIVVYDHYENGRPVIEYWLNTVDLFMPSDFLTFVEDDKLRSTLYYSHYWLPVGDSNMYYLDPEQAVFYELTGIKLIPTDEVWFVSGFFDHPAGVEIGGRDFTVHLEFSYVFTDDVTGEELRYNSFWLPLDDYLEDSSDLWITEIFTFPYG